MSWFGTICAIFTQTFVSAPPPLTEKNLPDQKGKVFLITGGSSGVGYELADILYGKNATVYNASRNEKNALKAIEDIKRRHPESTGQLKFIHLQLDNLSTIKATAESFLEAESRLDVLFNNAGIGGCPKGAASAQGHELIISTNCLGPFLFTQLLLHVLTKTASTSPCNCVRVIWASSILVDVFAPKDGVKVSRLNTPPSKLGAKFQYPRSKAGNWFLASEFPKHNPESKVIHLTQNPGTLKTPIWNQTDTIIGWLVNPILYPMHLGAYTLLWAGLSEKVDQSDNGRFVVPWGKWHPCPRTDLIAAMKAKGQDGGTGAAEEFWKWCDEKTRKFR